MWVAPNAALSQGPPQFDSLLASAQQAQARGEFGTAAEFYRKAVTLQPQVAELRANLGLMYYQTGKDEDAIQAFREALRLKPGLFVPNLFLGLDCVRTKRFAGAIPYLKQAAVLNSSDVQVYIALGQAYAGIGKTRLATASYLRAVKIDPRSADGWFHTGVSYMQQIEANARILLAEHKDSGYLQALMADTFADQRKFIQAAEAYKASLASPSFPPGMHAGYGFALLNQNDLAGAERELNAELALNRGSLIAKLGLARLHLAQGATPETAKELEDIWNSDAGFLRANAPLFNAGLSARERSELEQALRESPGTRDIWDEIANLSRSNESEKLADSTERSSPATADRVRPNHAPIPNPTELYVAGRYQECSDMLAPRLQLLKASELQVLAACAYPTGDYETAVAAAQKLAAHPTTEAEGLYWGTKSAEKLATKALARAGEIDSTSPRLHVLLGDVYRQRRSFPDAEREYHKALSLLPEDTGAMFGLSLALLADSQTDEALKLAQAALQKSPGDPELNALMGEILSAQRDYPGAEPYLKKGLNAQPELVPHVHALLGKVYAETDRTPEAIAELKLGLADDKDGSLHYQIARLYLKIGDRDSAKTAFEVSERMRREGLVRAAVAIQQGESDSNSQ
jgi:tetratricopeptide (TPR) repeat protein